MIKNETNNLLNIIEDIKKKGINIVNNINIYNKNYNYKDYILNNKEIIDLDYNINNNINNKTIQYINKNKLYDNMKKIKIKNYDCLIYEINNNLYKYYDGFITKNQYNKYKNENIIRPFVLNSKYIAYLNCRERWGSIVVFNTINDLILFDLFNKNNIKLLINDINKLDNNFNKNKIIEYIKNITGYEQSIELQLKYRNIIDSKYCYTIYDSKINDLNPFYCNIYDEELIIIISYLYKEIDGIIKKQINSNHEFGGIYINEEIILNHKSLNKLEYNIDNELNWTNYKIKTLDNNRLYRGIKFNGENNSEFNLIRYLVNNNVSLNQIKNNINDIYNNDKSKFNKYSKYILSYDINNFINLNKNIKTIDNINNIIELINIIYKYTNKMLYYIFLINFDIKKEFIIDKLKKIGFNFSILCENNNSNILFLSKENEHEYYKLNMNNIYYNIIKNNNNLLENDIFNMILEHKIDYNNLIININDVKICCLNLKNDIIFDKYKKYYLIDKYKNDIYKEINNYNFEDYINNKINKMNSLFRLYEIDRIMIEKIDICIGNFNFMIYDKLNNMNHEVKKLTLNNYLNYNNINQKYSMIEGRTDHIYSNKKLDYNNIIKCNFSNHLPLLQLLNF